MRERQRQGRLQGLERPGSVEGRDVPWSRRHIGLGGEHGAAAAAGGKAA